MKYLKYVLFGILFLFIEAFFAIFIVEELFCGCSGSSELSFLIIPIITHGVFCFSCRKHIKAKMFLSIVLSLWVIYLTYSHITIGTINIGGGNLFAQTFRILSLSAIFLSPLTTFRVHSILVKKEEQQLTIICTTNILECHPTCIFAEIIHRKS